MNQPDDVRKLLGGYATGSLTDAERKLLFDAAMDDQDLFDEIAGEHALKEILDEPGARQRLLAVLEPKTNTKAAWWPWVAGAAALFSAVVIAVVSNRAVPPRQPAPQQEVAQVMKSEQPAPQPVATPRADAPVRKKVAPPTPSALVPEPAPQVAMDKISEPSVSGFARGGRGGAAPRAAIALSAPQEFAFRYAVSADGVLEIIPAAGGFLSVTANSAVVFPSRAVTAGTPVRIQIPSDATNLIVGFSATPGITGPPVRRDETSGIAADQDPPNGRIAIQLFLTPRTQ